MGLPDMDTSVGHSFGLEIDGIVIKQISEVSGLKMEQDVIDLPQNTDKGVFMRKKLPGRPKPGEVTLSRGLTSDQSFEKWAKDAQFGKMAQARKGGSIIVYDFEGKELKRYNLRNAWPKSLEIGTLKAGDTTVLMEKLVIVHEGMMPA